MFLFAGRGWDMDYNFGVYLGFSDGIE